MSALKVPLVSGQQRVKAKKAKFDRMLALLPAKSEQADMNSIGLNDQNPIENIVEGGNEIVRLDTEINATPITMSAKRKRRSVVWGYFELLPSEKDERQRCRCRNCGTSYLYDSKFGTGNMKRHLVNCLKRITCDTEPLLLTQFDSSIPSSSPKFDREKFKELLTEAVISHDLPFQFVEWKGVRALLAQLCANLQLGNRNTVGVDCIAIHRREKAKVQTLLEETPSKVSFTYDIWSSLTSDGYICLTAHFIDKDWNMQKKILNFCLMPPPYGDIYIAVKIYNFLIEWGVDKRVSTFTVNGDNIASIELLKGQLDNKGLLCEGAFFRLNCCACIIDLIVKEGLKEIDYAVNKVRESIKYVKGSQTRKRNFLECVNHSSLEDKRGLRQDVSTWWNSTFIMLESALYYRRAFSHLELIDSNYKDCPSDTDWDNIEKIGKLLSVFHEIMDVFSNAKDTTANLYFPVVFSAYLTLREEMGSDDEYLRSMATLMFSKFENYWSDCHILLIIAVILDPRYKFSFVEWCYKKLYDDAGVVESMKVREILFSLFSEYVSTNKLLSGPPNATASGTAVYDASSQGNLKVPEKSFSKEATDVFREFDSFESEESVSQKSQLELYLDEPRLDRKARLDILAYWRGNQFRYPEVAAMARDILSIPISTITVENAFDTSGRVLDQYYSALNPDILEAFICTRDWFNVQNEMTRVTLEDLTKNILELNDDDRIELPECSNSGNMRC